LAPSPHMRTVYPIDCNRSTTSFFSSGDMRAKTWHRASICARHVRAMPNASKKASVRVVESRVVHC
jgi:hypothetical protein